MKTIARALDAGPPARRLARGVRQERVAKGQCPNDGSEAAPYLLCWSCRLKQRLGRSLKRGAKLGAIKKDILNRYSIDKTDDGTRTIQWGKWGTPIVLNEDDGRGRPRLRGTRIDIEATIHRVMEFIGRPCTIEEIMAAFGRLRAKRSDPLPADLARIIVADEKRHRKAAKRAEQFAAAST